MKQQIETLNMYDLINKKKHGQALTENEIAYIITGFVNGIIPDYQMSAMLMAIYFRQMTTTETAHLTKVMANSGDRVDLSGINGRKIDKHSTGGVGDKTTFIVSPIVASCGVYAPKMSGRGLGHTGGTADKLESIPNYRTDLSLTEFIEVLNTCRTSLITQSGTLARADKLLYALRDVTATVDSLPLIASSIMSKKLASGADGILLDVKIGEGAFMKNLADGTALAKAMVAIGQEAGVPTAALLSNMDEPLGKAIGNSLEVIEAVEVLQGGGSADLVELSLRLAGEMLVLAELGSIDKCLQLAKEAITSGQAFDTFCRMVRLHGGDDEVLRDVNKFPQAKVQYNVIAEQSGYITRLNAEDVGRASVMLGAGRTKKDDAIDYTAGIYLHKKYGHAVNKGEVVATLYAGSDELLQLGANKFVQALVISAGPPPPKQLIYGLIS